MWLSPKLSAENSIAVQNFRPIHISTVLNKLYLRCLYMLVKMHWQIGGWIQLGAGSGHCATELVHVVRILIEKCLERDQEFVIIAIFFGEPLTVLILRLPSISA